jgi:phosphoenolpyruvate carboxykinase (GTP)
MAMLPFCGYNIGDYFQHWLDIGKQLTNPPLILQRELVSQRRRTENSSGPVSVKTCACSNGSSTGAKGSGGALKSPIGWLPSPHDLDLAELDIDHNAVDELLGLDHEEWQKEIAAHKEFFDSLGGVVPEELQKQREQLAAGFEL